MTIALTGTGGLFSRLGKLIKYARHINGTRGSVAAYATSGTPTWGSAGTPATIVDANDAFSAVYAQYEANPSTIALVAALPAQLATFQSSIESQITAMQSVAQATLIYMANADTPLQQQTVQAAMALLQSQMITNSDYITGNTVTVTPAAGGSNVGNATLVASVIDQNGYTMQYVFPETISVSVTQDFTRGATLGNEALAASGTGANTDSYSQTWPQGSGAINTPFNVCDSTKNNAGGNILTNSSFSSFVNTPNLPDQWVKVVGTVGTNIKQGATFLSGGVASLQYVGDSSTLLSITQTFGNASTGTAGTLSGPPIGPQTSVVTAGVYALSAWVYVDVVPAGGVLQLDLINGSGTIIANNKGTNNSVNVSIPGLSATTWTQVTAFFQLPNTPPSTISLRIHMTTALSTGSNLFIDNVALTAATQMYVGGPFMACFRYTTDVVQTDTFTITAANTLGTTGGVFTEWMERFFQMRSTLGIMLPVAGSTAIADSLCQ